MDRNTKKALVVIVIAAAVGAAMLAVGFAWVFGPRPRVEPTPRLEDGRGAQQSADYGQVPPFALIDQHERPVTRDDLLGHVWVAEFIFTRCTMICPVMVAGLAEVRDAVADVPGHDALRLVSITVDPEHDRPDVLRDYAGRYDADSDNWLFLTAHDGEREPIWRLSEDGFMLGVFDDPDNPAMPIGHSSKLVLVDREANIRGYYDGTTRQGRAELATDLERMLGQ